MKEVENENKIFVLRENKNTGYEKGFPQKLIHENDDDEWELGRESNPTSNVNDDPPSKECDER